MWRKQSTLISSIFLLLLSLLSSGCGDSSSSGGTLTGIDIAPISPSIAVGGTMQFTATGHFSNGPDQNITAQSNWSSSSTATATIQQFGTSPGLATGVAAGKTTITASFAQGSSSVQGSTDLTVTSTVVVNPLNRGDGTVVLHGVGARARRRSQGLGVGFLPADAGRGPAYIPQCRRTESLHNRSKGRAIGEY